MPMRVDNREKRFFFPGIGSGTVFLLLQIFTMMYFDRFRGTALGIMSLGSTVSGFVFTKLIHFLAETYTLRSSLFILGAITMHINPLTYLLKVPPWHSPVPPKPPESLSSLTSTVLATDGVHDRTEEDTGTNATGDRGITSRFLQDIRFLMCCPMFHMLVLSEVMTVFTDYIFSSTFMDYAVDKGTSLSNATWLTSFVAVGDAAGRICLPVLADRGYQRRSSLLMINQLLMGIYMLLFPHVSSYIPIAVLTALVAGHVGCGLILQDVLVVDYFGVERLSVIMGTIGLLKIPLDLSIPAVDISGVTTLSRSYTLHHV